MIFYPASLSILRNLTFAPHCAVGNDATGGSDALRVHREHVAQLQAQKRKCGSVSVLRPCDNDRLTATSNSWLANLLIPKLFQITLLSSFAFFTNTRIIMLASTGRSHGWRKLMTCCRSCLIPLESNSTFLHDCI